MVWKNLSALNYYIIGGKKENNQKSIKFERIKWPQSVILKFRPSFNKSDYGRFCGASSLGKSTVSIVWFWSLDCIAGLKWAASSGCSGLSFHSFLHLCVVSWSLQQSWRESQQCESGCGGPNLLFFFTVVVVVDFVVVALLVVCVCTTIWRKNEKKYYCCWRCLVFPHL